MTGRILIVDDVATNRIVMKVQLLNARYDVVTASSGMEALTVARAGGVDIVIMDIMMPSMSGVEACRQLQADPRTASIPVILVTAFDDQTARLTSLSAGACDFLTRPVNEVALLARVRSLLRNRSEERDYHARGGAILEQAQPVHGGLSEGGTQAAFTGPAPVDTGRIALIAADGVTWPAAQRDRLAQRFAGAVQTLGAETALELTEATAPDLFLIDADLTWRNEGLRLMADLRTRTATRHAAYVVLLPEGDSERAAMALDLGAADVSHHPFSVDEVAMRLRTQLMRKRRADKMRDTMESGLKLAMFDALTGLHNRRYALHQLGQVATRCRMQDIRAGVILMDIDHFKRVNDAHGHPVGDACLARVAKVLDENLRAQDMVARIGGEEFLTILPDTDLNHVRTVAERLRRAIECLEVPLPDGGKLSVTLSLGAGLLRAEDSIDETLSRVDRALYSAKDAGRNQVMFCA